MKPKIRLGQTVRDVITWFQGVATGRAEYISGCQQVLVAPSLSEDGSSREAQWFDEQRLMVIHDVPTIILDNGATPGCDRQAPKR